MLGLAFLFAGALAGVLFGKKPRLSLFGVKSRSPTTFLSVRFELLEVDLAPYLLPEALRPRLCESRRPSEDLPLSCPSSLRGKLSIIDASICASSGNFDTGNTFLMSFSIVRTS